MSVSRPACFYIPQIIFFFFDELTLALSKAVIKLDNLIVKDIAILVCSGYDKLNQKMGCSTSFFLEFQM